VSLALRQAQGERALSSKGTLMKAFWEKLGKLGRTGLLAGAIFVLLATALLGYWLLRADYQVLFSGLSPQDAAAVTAELERQRVPYELDESLGEDGGTTVLVDRKDVYRTRLKVMGKELPLHGAVGFELFNNSDFGMTEFAQRINYQRALQGELARTIMSLSEVRDARVLLALPEQGLFKRDRAKPTASITLTLRSGKTLTGSQVSGIQRLVAASIPGIAAQDVTIVDQSGIALSRPSGDADGGTGVGRLDLKRDTELYLTRKVSEVLDRTLGEGEALASVDVTLEMDRVQTTTEDVVPAQGTLGRMQTGVVVRERETVRELGAPLTTQASAGAVPGPQSGSSQREVEYAVGKRVEQVVGQPGSIRRIQVVAVVKKALDANQQEQLRKLVSASVGAVAERGDAVVVQSMATLAAPASPPAGSDAEAPASARAEEPAAAGVHERPAAVASARTMTIPLAGALGAVAIALTVLVALTGRRRRAAGESSTLSDADRKVALAQVQGWLRGSGPQPGWGAGR
jgi:flagellar M-ring protein FliF